MSSNKETWCMVVFQFSQHRNLQANKVIQLEWFSNRTILAQKKQQIVTSITIMFPCVMFTWQGKKFDKQTSISKFREMLLFPCEGQKMYLTSYKCINLYWHRHNTRILCLSGNQIAINYNGDRKWCPCPRPAGAWVSNTRVWQVKLFQKAPKDILTSAYLR